MQLKVRLNHVDNIRYFIYENMNAPFAVYIKSDNMIFDGKSLINLFSMDLSKPFIVFAETEDVKLVSLYKQKLQIFLGGDNVGEIIHEKNKKL